MERKSVIAMKNELDELNAKINQLIKDIASTKYSDDEHMHWLKKTQLDYMLGYRRFLKFRMKWSKY